MKILFLMEGIPYPPLFGHKSAPFNLIKQLTYYGHRVFLITVTDNPDEMNISKLEELGVTVFPVIYKAKRSAFSYLLSLLSKYPYGVISLANRSISSEVKGIVEEIQPNILQVEFIACAHLAARLNIPKIIMPCDSLSAFLKNIKSAPIGHLRKAHSRIQYYKVRDYESRFYSAFDKCISVTPYDAKALRDAGVTADINVIPQGVDTDYFNPIAKTNDRTSLVFLGNMSYIHNQIAVHDFCRNILPLIQREVPDIALKIVGHNPDRTITELQGPNIIVTGSVADVRPYLTRESVFIAPFSFPGGFKNKILEAMAMGMAVVGTKAAFSGIDIRNGQHVLIADEDHQFANMAIRLIKEPSLKETLGNNSRGLTEARYTWNRIAAEYVNIYEELIP
jgi:hypothetical protein